MKRAMLLFCLALSIPVGMMTLGAMLSHQNLMVAGYLLTILCFASLGLFFKPQNQQKPGLTPKADAKR